MNNNTENEIRIKEIVFMGIFSTVVMDFGYLFTTLTKIVEPSMQSYHIGRWLLNMLQGTFIHNDIRAIEAIVIEKPVSLIAHYLTGIILAGVFLMLRKKYKIFSSSILMGMVFGWITLVIPWFIMYPALGFGFLGLDCPENTNYILFSVLNHSFYGLGITLWLGWVGKNKMSHFKFYFVCLIFKIKSTLKQELGNEMSRRVMEKAKHFYHELDSLKPKAKGIMRFHRTVLILSLAVFRAMKSEVVDRNDLIDIVHKMLWRSTPCGMMRFQAFFIRRRKDPYNVFLKNLGPRNEWFYTCPPWKKVEVQLENGLGWDQFKCPYYEFMKQEGEIELTRALCDLDLRVAKLVPDHIELKRLRTLALGDSSCDFYYYQR